MYTYRKSFRILFFVAKVGIGIFELKNGMIFFLVLSPIIQIISWCMLLGRIRLNKPYPSETERVKQSKTQCQFVFNYLISSIDYYCSLSWVMLKLLPLSIGITVLQEIKIFPFCLFGYTYVKYKTILTRDLMKNLAAHLFLLEEIEAAEEERSRQEQQATHQNQHTQQAMDLNGNPGALNEIFPSNPLLNPPINIIGGSNPKLQPQNSSSPSSNSPSPTKKMTYIQQMPLKKQPSSQVHSSQSSIYDSDYSPIHSRALRRLAEQDFHAFGCRNQNITNINNNKQSTLLLQPLLLDNQQIESSSKNLPDIPENSSEETNQISLFNLFPNQPRKDSVTIQHLPIRKKSHQQSIFFKNSNEMGDNQFGSPGKIRNRIRTNSKSKFMESLEKSSIGNLFKMTMIPSSKTQKRLSLPKLALQHSQSPQLQQSQSFINIVTPQQDQLFNETDLLLDANIVPNFETLITDQNLESFLLITDVIEAIFEALPMTVLQYVNNGINSSWYYSDGSRNYFLAATFITSLLTIFFQSISLLKILYDENIQIFYCTLQFLEKFKDSAKQLDKQKKQQHISQNDKDSPNSKKQKEAEGFGRIFPMSAEIKIETFLQINKLTMLRKKACQEIKILQFIFNDDPFYAPVFHDNIYKSLTRIRSIKKLQIEFNGNDFSSSICPLLSHILCDLPFLSNLSFSFYDSTINRIDQEAIYSSLNSWILLKEGEIEELLFESEPIFMWRCLSYKQKDNNDRRTFKRRFQELCSSPSEEKTIIEIVLPDKELPPQESEELADGLNTWVNLQHFQVIVKHIPPLYQDLLIESLNSNENLASCLVVTESNGLLIRKGFSTEYDSNKNFFKLENSYFYQNADAMQFVFQRELKQLTTSSLSTASIIMDCKDENQRKLKDNSVKHLMKLVATLKGIITLDLCLKNNNLGPSSGNPIGGCLEGLKNLRDLHIDLSENKLGAIGFSNIIQALIKAQHKFRDLQLFFSWNQIQNEGALCLLQLLKQYYTTSTQDSSHKLNLTNRGNQPNSNFNIFNANSIKKFSSSFLSKVNENNAFNPSLADPNTMIIEEEKEGTLQKLSLDLSNNRLSKDMLDQLMKSFCQISSLSELMLKLSGNILQLQDIFDFQLLEEIQSLSLIFWCNEFSQTSLRNFLSSLLTVSRKLTSLSLELIDNNLNDEEGIVSQVISNFNMLRTLNLVFSKNGTYFTRLAGFDNSLLQAQLIENLSINVSQCNFDYQGVEELVRNIRFLVSLQVLQFDFAENPNFDDNCSNSIIEVLHPLPKLQFLALNYQATAITDAAVILISERIPTMLQLRTISFVFLENKTTDLSRKHIVDSLIACKHITQPHFRI